MFTDSAVIIAKRDMTENPGTEAGKLLNSLFSVIMLHLKVVPINKILIIGN